MIRTVFGSNKSGTALIPYFDSLSIENFSFSTRTGDFIIDWKDGTTTNSNNSLSPKNTDFADGSNFVTNAKYSKTYSSAYTGNISVKFLKGLKDVYSILLAFGHSTNQQSKLNIIDVETFFKQFPNLYSIAISDLSSSTTSRMSVVKGDFSKLPDSVEKVQIQILDVINAKSDAVLNLSNYSNTSKLKYFQFGIAYYYIGSSKLKLINDLGNLPVTCEYFYLTKASTSNESAITYTAGKVWASSFDTLYLPILLTVTETDNLLIDLYNSVTTAIGGKLIDLKGFRSSVSDVAVAGLQALGFTVNCERYGVILDLPLQNNFTDYSVSGISMVAGNVNGLPSFVSDGSGGYALDFGGTKSIKTSVNLPISNVDSISIEYDIKTSATGVQMILELSGTVGSNNAFYNTMNETANKIWLLDHNQGVNIVISGTNVNTGSWVNVKIIIDRSKGNNQSKIYINDVLSFTQAPSPNNADNNGNFGSYPLFIGQRNGTSFGFVGQYRNLKIYNYPIL